jgi:thioredoxin reductase
VKSAELGDKRFAVFLESGERHEALIILLATGLIDELPDLKGLRECYGDTAHSCPYCDGWERRDQSIAVLGNTQAATELAIELKIWSDDITPAANGPLRCDSKSLTLLRRCGIQVL